ncbi:hypothetical protein LH433_04835 [Laribacter hongkongensis]|uniref:hypothetical protein n=1 Tax=Laribacter hongkongensis TaxID=168471 RepID=UPI001EFE1F02|nr:hypothetical protein [Laribacter hongkongensis]MCG9106080.1 hypothetical protein [Laribacter hongkongensis]
MDSVQSVNNQSANVLDQSAIYAIKKQREVVKDTVTTLINSVGQSSSRTVNPAHLGQNVDVRA